MFTVEQAKAWADERIGQLTEERLSYTDSAVKMINKLMPELSKNLWNSSAWLGEALRQHGATDIQVQDIQMAQGQRSVYNDPWKVAVDYANEFATSGDTVEKGGLELAIALVNDNERCLCN